jgi:hypothetical protein
MSAALRKTQYHQDILENYTYVESIEQQVKPTKLREIKISNNI